MNLKQIGVKNISLDLILSTLSEVYGLEKTEKKPTIYS